MKTAVTLVPGDGIGSEVTQATVRVLEAAGAEIDWEERNAQPFVGHRSINGRVENALHRVYEEGRHLTRDVGGSASTADFTSAVCEALA